MEIGGVLLIASVGCVDSVILLGCGNYWGSRWRANAIIKELPGLIACRYQHGPARYCLDALSYNRNLYDLFLNDLAVEKIDGVVSDGCWWAKRAAKDLKVPLISISSIPSNFDTSITISSPFSFSSVASMALRSTEDEVDVVALIRNPDRQTSISSLLKKTKLSYGLFTEMNDAFWQAEKKSSIFITEGDGESMMIGMSGQHPLVIVASATDIEQTFNAKVAAKLGAASLGEIELSNKFSLRWLMEGIEKARAIPYEVKGGEGLIEKIKSSLGLDDR